MTSVFIKVTLKNGNNYYFDLSALEGFGEGGIMLRRNNQKGAIKIEIQETLEAFMAKLKEAGAEVK